MRYADGRATEHRETYDVLMVANGHHWDPRHPEYEGRFTGVYLHSHEFKRVTDAWRGKNVLVIGAGNSGCDIAVEAAGGAGKVCLSMRSPQWFFRKFLAGVPSDVVMAYARWLPPRLRQAGAGALLRLMQGPYSRYGLPANTTPPLSQHPTLNSGVLQFLRDGRIQARPAARRLLGRDVEFVDGRREAFDILCACTGFWTSSDMTRAIQQELDNPHFRFVGGPRHAAEVDYFRLRDELRIELRKAGIEIGRPSIRRKRFSGSTPAAAPSPDDTPAQSQSAT